MWYRSTHYIFAIAKCTTVQLGISLEGFTYKNVGAETSDCPSWNAAHSISKALPYPQSELWNGGMNLSWINARVICKNDGKGHCDEWTEKEADLAATPLVIFCFVCARLDIPVFLPNFGGTRACQKILHCIHESLPVDHRLQWILWWVSCSHFYWKERYPPVQSQFPA